MTATFHNLLLRQIKRHFGSIDKIPTDLIAFISSVNVAYREYDTDREMLERSLELSSQEMLQTNAELWAVFSALPDILFVIDGTGTILDQKSRSADDIFPHSGKTLVGMRIQDIPDREVGEKLQGALEAVKRDKSLFSVEYQLTIGGTPSFYEARFTPLIENRYVVIVRNITDRKLAEMALLKERDFVKTLVQTSPTFFIALDHDFRVITINDAMLDATGFTTEEVVGGDSIQLFLPQDAQVDFINKLRDVEESTRAAIIEAPLLCKNGRILNVEWRGRAIFTNDGCFDFFFSVGIDVTGKRQLEAKLQQSRKLEAIGTLAGGVAHDFNNLLMGIQGRVSLMMLDADETHPFHAHLMAMQESIKSAATLTRQLLGFARGGKYEVRPTNINDLIEKNIDLYGRTNKDVSIVLNLQPNIWAIEADQDQIDQALLNIYLNAFQAMPQGGELKISTANATLDPNDVERLGLQAENYVRIAITDTGIGMDKETQQRIFDPFFSTKDHGRGTGLGLASTYGIIKNHDGMIEVQSEKGVGAAFTIYLPASMKKVKPTASAFSTEIKQGQGTILFVDDEEIVIEVGKNLLSALGYAVITAGGGSEALEILKERAKEIDLVILDIIMPGMSGSETFDQIKKIAPAVKVLLASGYSLEGQAKAILDRGCDGFIQKPFDLYVLSNKICQVLSV